MKNNLSIVKDEMKNKDINGAKDLVEQFREAANINLKNKTHVSNKRKALSDFNILCEQIKDGSLESLSRQKTANKYKKCLVVKMDLFLKEFENAEK